MLQYSTIQHSNSFKRARRSLQSSTPLSSVSESASPSPRLSGLNPEVIEHINALKHLKDDQIFMLLAAARSDDRRLAGPDRSSMSTLASRSSSYLSVPSSRVTSMMSDPRSSIASTDSSYTHYSAASSRLSTASSRLSTISTSPAPKNFACTFCDKALKSKPYWKSHEEEFHEQRLTWRCPDCEQIFHAGKRFREHHTKLHGCESCKQPRESGQPTSRKASPCVKKYEIVMHNKDAWGCGFCANLLTSWEDRCEHIASHFEEKRSKWDFTNVILGLLKQPDVSLAWNKLLTDRHGEQQNWPKFTWGSKKCNRLRYKLETKWDTRVFDIDSLVKETYDLAEIELAGTESEATDVIEPSQPKEAPEPVGCKQEEKYDFAMDQPTLPSSQELPAESTMMELDPVDTMQNIQPPVMQQPAWPVPSDMMQQNTMAADVNMDAFNGFSTDLNTMSTDFMQQSVPHVYQTQNWSNAGFASTPDLLNFQQPGNYMEYTPAKPVIQVPTSQFATFVRPSSQHSSHQSHSNFIRPCSQQSQHANPNFGHVSSRQSVPPNWLHNANTAGARRYTPKLVNITSTSQRVPSGDQPPPPPPKDDHRFSKILMRRRPSNISQHTVSSQHTIMQRDMGWHGEETWG